MSFSEKFNIFKKYVAWFLLISSAISAAAAALIVLWPGGAVGGSPFQVLTLLARIGFSFLVTGLLLLIHKKKLKQK